MYNLTDKDVEMLEAFFYNTLSEKDKSILHNRFVSEPDFKLEFEQHLALLRVLQKKRMLDTRNYLKNIDVENLDNNLSLWSKYSWLVIASLLILLSVLSYCFYKFSNSPQPEKSIIPIVINDSIPKLDTIAQSIKQDTISKIRAKVNKRQNINSQKYELIASLTLAQRSKIVDQYYVRPTFATARSIYAETLRDSLVYWYNKSEFDSVINHVEQMKLDNPEIEFLVAICYYEKGNFVQAEKILSKVHGSGIFEEEVNWYFLLSSVKIGIAPNEYKKMASNILSNHNHFHYKDTKKLLLKLEPK